MIVIKTHKLHPKNIKVEKLPKLCTPKQAEDTSQNNRILRKVTRYLNSKGQIGSNTQSNQPHHMCQNQLNKQKKHNTKQ